MSVTRALLDDDDMAVLVERIRTVTAGDRLSHAEVVTMIRTLESNGITITLPPEPATSKSGK